MEIYCKSKESTDWRHLGQSEDLADITSEDRIDKTEHCSFEKIYSGEITFSVKKIKKKNIFGKPRLPRKVKKMVTKQLEIYSSNVMGCIALLYASKKITKRELKNLREYFIKKNDNERRLPPHAPILSAED